MADCLKIDTTAPLEELVERVVADTRARQALRGSRKRRFGLTAR
jgi:hypothetical protein